MMATKEYIGAAVATAQVDSVTPANVGIGNQFHATINGKTVTFVATAATVANVTAGLAAAINASTIPEFRKVTATDNTTNILVTARTAGEPFTLTSSATGGTATNVRAAVTANSGPYVAGLAANYSDGALPANGDTLILQRPNMHIRYDLEALSAVTLAQLDHRATWNGEVGLPDWNAGGYSEYLPKYLKIGATLTRIGYGPGNGSGRFKLDNAAIEASLTVYHTPQGVESGIPAFLWKGTHASNDMSVMRGHVGIAFFGGEAANLIDLNISYVSSIETDANVTAGNGAVWAGSTIDKAGGTLRLASDFATLRQSGGTTTVQGDGLDGTTATIEGGIFNFWSNGTITNFVLGSGAEYNGSGDLRTKTLTNFNVYGDTWRIVDPFRGSAFTNGIILNHCAVEDGFIDLGEHVTLAVTYP